MLPRELAVHKDYGELTAKFTTLAGSILLPIGEQYQFQSKSFYLLHKDKPATACQSQNGAAHKTIIPHKEWDGSVQLCLYKHTLAYMQKVADGIACETLYGNGFYPYGIAIEGEAIYYSCPKGMLHFTYETLADTGLQVALCGSNWFGWLTCNVVDNF